MLLAIQIWNSTATDILYVLPDNSTNAVSCPSKPCATLSKYLLDNSTIPVLSNVEYHFLPGEHHVPANMTLQDLHNFSIIGTVSKPSPLAVLVLADCPQSYIINIIDSYNVTIANVILKQCDHPQLTNLLITVCYSCIIENVTFIDLGLVVNDLIGTSHLSKIVMTANRRKLLMYTCQGITLTQTYWIQEPFIDHKHLLIMNQINIIGGGNKCYSNNAAGLRMTIYAETLTITLTNSVFSYLPHTALFIDNKCRGKNTISIENCTVESNTRKYNSDGVQVTPQSLIYIVIAHDNKSITFKHCNFIRNHFHILIRFHIRSSMICHLSKKDCINPLSIIRFVACQFNYNAVSVIIYVEVPLIYCKPNLFLIGPSNFSNNECKTNRRYNSENTILLIFNTNIDIIGSVLLSSNNADNIIVFDRCNATFYDKIIFKWNKCSQVLNLKSTCIRIMEYADVTLLENFHTHDVIKTDCNYQYNLYPLCIFQFVTLINTTTVSTAHYSINIIGHLYYNNGNMQRSIMCKFPLYITPHCKWISTAAFQEYDSTVIYQQIIKVNNQKFIYHKICHCSQNGSKNCNVNTLGPIYPGQTLQVELCTPCDDKPSTLYAEVNSIHLPASACKVAPQTETTSIISNYSTKVNFTIVSDATKECELFLIAATSDIQSITETYFVQLLSCPTGFTLQSGVCDCDPVLSPYSEKCYIDISTIRRPANTWITARSQTNNTKYLISDCPMDYCIPYTSNINLLYPDLQCQFNRTGVLCSRCQHHLSMVFGSSRCIKCTNLHIFIITIIVIVAGIVLVMLLYLLNLTVTNGTINGIIFYANIVSINDSVFLINDNVFKPLRVFMSFINLDLGIETCFYNGMDSYAKMWLQLFFPLYLISIAVSIITASRYSSKIFRLTYTRSLPVLATLFLLSYTGVLRTVLTVLFSYSSITYLPSGHKQIVWSIDASVPLFGLKFTILFITCLVLFLLLIPFNITLLFTRYLSQFRTINHFKPLLDAFQGSYKDRYYYWVAIHLTMRSLLFAMYGFQTSLKLILSTMLLIIFSIYNGRIYPYKNKLVNIQELLLLLNLTIMYAVSYQSNESIFSTVTNVMISLAFIQFCTIVLYHFLTYTCHCNIEIILQISKEKLIKFCHKNHSNHHNVGVELLNVPERTYNYAEYQDGLVSDDFT